nr:hypothetical protein [Tanacetum cinerariifolium]
MIFHLVNGNSFDCPPDSYHPSHPTYETYSGDSCGNGSHFGYDYPPRFPFNYEPEPGYIQNYNSYPHDSSSFPQHEPEGEKECDVPTGFTTFSNVLFDADYDFDSGDDQSTFNEDFLRKIYLNPLFDEEINPIKIDQHSFNDESDLIESMHNYDSSFTISSKIDSLFDEFASELNLLKSIPPGIDETDCHHEKETRFAKIVDDDYDSRRDILILEELLDNYSLSLSANKLYHFDIPLPYHPPAKPPDVVQYSRKCEDSRQRYFVLKSSFPLYKLGIT